VVISTSGQSLYELAALKIPTLSICINKNQKMDAISFKREKLIENIFLKERKLLVDNIILELRKFKSARFRKNIKRKLNKYKFDGKLLKKKIEKYVSEYYSS
jgi:spore coat polysaccharide biosynthesis predicted glycosyltransferase SpsG